MRDSPLHYFYLQNPNNIEYLVIIFLEKVFNCRNYLLNQETEEIKKITYNLW